MSVLVAVLIACFAIDAWARVGYVHASLGSASSQRGSAPPVPIKVGDTFEEGTVFATGGDGRVTLQFADGQVLVLAPSSRVYIRQYRFDPRNVKAGNLAIRLQDGALRFVGGASATQNREAVRISAGESVVSILRAGGIDFTVAVNTNGQEVGVAAVTLGEVAVRTPYGPILRIEADQAVPWRPGTTPPPPIPIAAAPAAIQAELAGLRSMVLPGNTPVAIDAAARAAMANAGQPQPSVTAAHAGFVQALHGSVIAQGPAGRAMPVSVGDTFDAGTTFNTAENGRVVLQFADGQTVMLGPTSIARVEQYRFDQRNIRASSTGIELLNGSMRFVGGVIEAENRDGVRVTAGASIVQILSTGPLDFTVVVDTRAQELGVAAVTVGEIAIRTPYGRISSIQANEAAPWLPGRPLAPPVPLAQAPTAVAGEIAALLATAVPGNRPVAVDAVARAVVARATADQAQTAAAASPGNSQLHEAARAATDVAAAAATAAASATENLVAAIVEAQLAALPATAAGPADFSASPIVPIPVVTGGGGRCVGSPC